MEEEESVMTSMNIPYLNLQAITSLHGNEIQTAVTEVVGSGWYLQGKRLQTFEQHFSTYIGTRHCVGVANGLDAITLTLRAYIELGMLNEGDEVIVPANTFIATVLAITENRLKPIFIDIKEKTLDIDIEALEKSISKKTKALMLVHLYGRCTYNEHINTFCKDNNLILIEDNAQAHGCIYSQNRKTGSLGNIGCHSFYPGKNLGALGDGGAITTNNDTLAETIRSIANYGFKEKYVAEYQGRNSRLDDIQAAVLDVKLSHLDEDNQRRQAIAHTYYKYIENPKVALPSQLADENNVYHIFPLFTAQRDALQQHLESRGIQTLIHYPIPPHKQTCYRQWNHIHMPVAEKLATQELSIPLHPAMTDEMAKYIIDAINAF